MVPPAAGHIHRRLLAVPPGHWLGNAAMNLTRLRAEWLGNIKGDLLAGTVVALALIPEAIAFSIIAGVDPRVGLFASFSIAVIIAIVGGRPGDDLGGHGGNRGADGHTRS